MKSKIIMDGRLEVLEDGTVYRIKDGGRSPAAVCTSGRYRTTSIYDVGIGQRNLYIHRLVADAFIPNPENKQNVCFIDGDSLNLHVSNLRWATPQEQGGTNMLKSRITMIKTCKVCGDTTYAKDAICTICKKAQKQDDLKRERELKEIQKRSEIDKIFGELDYSLLTTGEIKTIELRKKYLSYEEIAAEVGCSRQRVEQRIKRALTKNSAGPKVKKGDTQYLQRLKRKLGKQLAIIDELTGELDYLKESVKHLDRIIATYDLRCKGGQDG